MFTVAANGTAIPALGFGTYRVEGSNGQKLVEAALAAGYRHLDTAQIYGNEAEVGAAIAASGLSRDAIFLTTKVWPSNFPRAAFDRSVDESLARLRADRVDLLLLHWPAFATTLREAVELLVAVRERGQAKAIGVSNFNLGQLGEAFEVSGGTIVTNQVEYHPFLAQHAMLARLRARGMALTAYSPLARGDVGRNETLKSIASEKGRTPGQIALRWLVQQPGVLAIPKTGNPARMAENIDVFSFDLTVDETARISRLGSPGGRQTSPAGLAPDWTG